MARRYRGGLQEEALTDIAHAQEKSFEFSMLRNGLFKEFSLRGR
jgi:hypothetical protein